MSKGSGLSRGDKRPNTPVMLRTLRTLVRPSPQTRKRGRRNPAV